MGDYTSGKWRIIMMLFTLKYILPPFLKGTSAFMESCFYFSCLPGPVYDAPLLLQLPVADPLPPQARQDLPQRLQESHENVNGK